MSYKETIIPILYKRKRELEITIKKAEVMLTSPIQDHLEISKIKNHYRYYLRAKTPDNTFIRKYIKDVNVAKTIATYDYAKKVYQNATRELSQVNALIETYHNLVSEDFFQNLHPARQLLVSPLLMDDEQYAALWLSQSDKNSTNTYPVNSPILTENNETVRSKSEKIIADKLKLSGVPYIYEKPIHMGNITKYPDFTVLNKRTRKEYYWEHMGLIDNPEYFKDAIKKLEVYFQNNIIPGKNLIITYETAKQPCSVKMLERIITEYLI